MSSSLLDCNQQAHNAELLVVEGKSARDAINRVRDRQSQAVLAMQGKPPNANQHSVSKMLENPQVQSLLAALGYTDEAKQTQGGIRYKKVCILTDADIDGAHCRYLIAQLFQALMSPLITAGRVYLIHAPLYRFDNPDGSTGYLWSDDEKQQFLDPSGTQYAGRITRFKGIASLNSGELSTLLIDPASRRESCLEMSSTRSF